MKTSVTIKKAFLLSTILLLLLGCKKSSNDGGGGGGNPPVDPPIANTIGFFLNDWAEQNFTVPAYEDATTSSSAATVFITVDASNIITKVPKTVFGQNANSWMTQIVTESSLMNNINNLHSGVVRFPGGSISDVYFWNQVNAPPADVPATLLDANGNAISNPYWYRKRNDSWTISVDSYYQLLQQ